MITRVVLATIRSGGEQVCERLYGAFGSASYSTARRIHESEIFAACKNCACKEKPKRAFPGERLCYRHGEGLNADELAALEEIFRRGVRSLERNSKERG